jgi:hypothetical protein
MGRRNLARKAGVLIISYRRAGRVKTIAMLRNIKWTGPVYLVISNDDDQRSQYLEAYDNVYIFDRSAVKCDYYDNGPPSGPLAARNIAWDIAKELGWTHFVLLDDDYSHLTIHREWSTNPKKRIIRNVPANWGDHLFHAMWDLLDAVPQIQCVSLSQTGDFAETIRRKVMQTFFLRTDRRFEFVARLNDDVTTYYDLGLRGEIVVQIPLLMVKQTVTQSQPGGLTEEYLQYGTYAKSMYTVLRWPAHCRIAFHNIVGRIHHRIATYPYPLIVKESVS